MTDRILIATFALWKNGSRTPINGMIEPLLSYLRPKSKTVDLIDGPHPGSSTVISILETYTKSKHVSTKKLWSSLALSLFLRRTNRNATQLLFKIRDMLSVFETVVRTNKPYNLFIGLEAVYTLAGIWVKKFGFVRTVVYYVSDYSPKRYNNKLLNALYLFLDRYCCRHADYIWDVSPAMMPARIKAGLNPKTITRHILVPNALFQSQIAPMPHTSIILHSLVYAGTLGQENGPQIAIEAVELLRRKYPAVTLHIFGAGPEEQSLREKTYALGLHKHVVFHGFISDLSFLTKQISRFMIGVAPYVYIKGSPRLYADATKLRLFMGAGLPVVTTRVPPLGRELETYGAGIVCHDTPKALAQTIRKLFTNTTLYRRMKTSTTIYARNNTWQQTYSQALKQMNI